MHENSEELKIGVVGSGSWGTALANLLAQKGLSVDLWAFEEEVSHEGGVLMSLNSLSIP